MNKEFDYKQELVHKLLAEKKLDALVLNRVSSLAWATCGASAYVGVSASDGVATLVITPSHHYLITNNIEAPRLEKEEQLADQGWEFLVSPWYEVSHTQARLTDGLKVGVDEPLPSGEDLSNDIARLRVNLTQPEGERFRKLGRECAQAMDQVMRSIRPGQTERQIAARLAMETETRGVQPVCLLVATDERIFSYRHPLPKDKTMEKYAMVVLCGRKWGLVCSLTRLVHFGPLSEEVRHKAEFVAQVDAIMIANTLPGRTLGEIFASGQAAYSKAGFPDEWRFHHQGGIAGYEAREFLAVPGMQERVAEGQVYAWNPSIRGTKSEDTILVTDSGNEILTVIPGWPIVTVQAEGQTLLRPAILEN